MLIDEAKWLAARMAELPGDDLFPMLNVGSSTERFRTADQPWIDRYIFAPARKRGGAVTHLDMKPDVGVDLVGDLADPEFLRQIQRRRFRSVFCSNLLEHVINRAEVASLLTEAVPEGGYLLISCPYEYPYHPDPIDTMFRPGPAELASLFPGTQVCRQEVVDCGTMLRYLLEGALRHPFRSVSGVARRLLPRRRVPEATSAPQAESVWPWAFTTLQATCVMLKKGPAVSKRGLSP
jgi:hypothetical protein